MAESVSESIPLQRDAELLAALDHGGEVIREGAAHRAEGAIDRVGLFLRGVDAPARALHPLGEAAILLVAVIEVSLPRRVARSFCACARMPSSLRAKARSRISASFSCWRCAASRARSCDCSSAASSSRVGAMGRDALRAVTR